MTRPGSTDLKGNWCAIVLRPFSDRFRDAVRKNATVGLPIFESLNGNFDANRGPLIAPVRVEEQFH